ncbi:MAG: BlaI/MecI/CopY family transcriptional regulator [Planctomycetota bacterium]|nr:BlaI/MecI/CopY family transcriptional regulator [Planctomycetota bacterium]
MRKDITEAELDVMDVLWLESPIAASDIHLQQDSQKKWSIQTVKTLLSRLVEKGVVAYERDGKRFLYRPLIKRGDYTQSAATRLVDKLFDGRVAPLISQLAEGRGLSDDDLEDIERLLEGLKHEH